MLSDWVDRLTGILFPARCVGCRRHGAYLCAACRPEPDPLIACPSCNELLPSAALHPRCAQRTGLAGLIVAGPYHGPLGAAVRELKYKFVTAIGVELADLLVGPIHQLLPEQVEALVPVPLHPTRRAERGFNQAEVIATPLGRRVGLPVLPLLDRTRPTPPQARLDAATRRSNLAGAFRVKAGPTPNAVALLDDVATTGTTLSECAKTLRAAGVREVWGITVARDR